jgi:hypothetical protein
MLELYIRYDLVMAPLKMANKSRNILDNLTDNVMS